MLLAGVEASALSFAGVLRHVWLDDDVAHDSGGGSSRCDVAFQFIPIVVVVRLARRCLVVRSRIGANFDIFWFIGRILDRFS